MMCMKCAEALSLYNVLSLYLTALTAVEPGHFLGMPLLL